MSQERLAELRAKKRLAELRAKKMQVQQQAQPQQRPLPQATQQPPAEQASGGRNWYDPVRSFLQGMTFNLSDEAGSGVAATIAEPKALFSGGMPSAYDVSKWLGAYTDIKDTVDYQRQQYEKEHPKEALGLNILGGVATGGAGLGKVLTGQGYKQAGNLGKAGRVLGVGAGEGAIAGFGAGDGLEGRSRGAIEGGATGALLSGALKGATTAVKKGLLEPAAKRRVEQDLLDKATGEWTPVATAAKEGTFLKTLYQRLAQPSFGGGQLREEASDVVAREGSKLEKATQKLDNLNKINEKANLGLRNKIAQKSLPQSADDVTQASVQNTNAQKALTNMDEAWKEGFQEVKDQTFNISPDKVAKDIAEKFDKPVDREFVDGIQKTIQDELTTGYRPFKERVKMTRDPLSGESIPLPQKDMNIGQIYGDDLIQARNRLRIKANELSSDKGSNRLEINVLNRAADYIDNEMIYKGMKEQVGAEAADRFLKEKGAWANYKLFEQGTSDALEQGGDFSSKQALKAAKKNQKYASARGKAPFQKKSEKLLNQEKARTKTAKKELKKANKAFAEAKKKGGILSPSAWTSTYTTGFLGSPVLSLVPMLDPLATPAVMGAGIATAKGLGLKPVQTAMAGQTGWQKGLQKGLQSYKQGGTPLSRALREGSVATQQGLSRAGSGYGIEEE